jgi:phosphoribosyl-AMP cyclohydrolase
MRFTLSGLFVFTQRTTSMNREINFDKMQGLAPAIVQDAASGEVLMLGFMNREAFGQTLSSGYVTFFSRTRNQLWTKEGTSGNRLKLVSATIDCDCDTLLLQVSDRGVAYEQVHTAINGSAIWLFLFYFGTGAVGRIPKGGRIGVSAGTGIDGRYRVMWFENFKVGEPNCSLKNIVQSLNRRIPY